MNLAVGRKDRQLHVAIGGIEIQDPLLNCTALFADQYQTVDIFVT